MLFKKSHRFYEQILKHTNFIREEQMKLIHDLSLRRWGKRRKNFTQFRFPEENETLKSELQMDYLSTYL